MVVRLLYRLTDLAQYMFAERRRLQGARIVKPLSTDGLGKKGKPGGCFLTYRKQVGSSPRKRQRPVFVAKFNRSGIWKYHWIQVVI